MFSKWHTTNRDYQIGNIVRLREEPTTPTSWPLERIVQIRPSEEWNTSRGHRTNCRRHIGTACSKGSCLCHGARGEIMKKENRAVLAGGMKTSGYGECT